MSDQTLPSLYPQKSSLRRAVPEWVSTFAIFLFLAFCRGCTSLAGPIFSTAATTLVAATSRSFLRSRSPGWVQSAGGLFGHVGPRHCRPLCSGRLWHRSAVGAQRCPGSTGRIRLAVLHSLPVICIAAAVIGFLVGFPAARLKGFFLAIATLALGELIVTIIRLDEKVWDGLKTNGGTGKQVPQFRVPGLDRILSVYMLSLGALFITMVAYVVLTNRRLGRTLKAVRDIDIATGPLGISSTYYKLLAFGISAFAAALAGAMWAQNSSFANPSAFRTRLLVFLLVVLIVGGLSHKWGPLIGAVFFVFLRQKLQDTQKLLFLILGITLILAVLILPNGIAALPKQLRDSRWVKDLQRRLETLTDFSL